MNRKWSLDCQLALPRFIYYQMADEFGNVHGAHGAGVSLDKKISMHVSVVSRLA